MLIFFEPVIQPMREEQATAPWSTLFAAEASEVHQRTTKQTALVANVTGTVE